MRKALAVMTLLTMLTGGVVVEAQAVDLDDHYGSMMRLLAEIQQERGFGSNVTQLLNSLAESGDPLYLAPLIDLAYFARGGDNPLFEAIRTLSGEDFGAD
ncbi:MAG: hypothetical protein K8L99_23565, partial [Anaerolineae bacterium]|nr:hypothetical protein [Anaerolineae bacterium]